MSNELFDRAADYFRELQDTIVTRLEEIDGEAKFHHDDWSRGEPAPVGDDPDGPQLGGGGRTRVLEDGRVFEKAGVNFSYVYGLFSKAHASTMPGAGREFRATGISLVLHPVNPYVPTVHMNYRRIMRGDDGWFGGGADLTPYYLDHADARHFHRTYRDVCGRHAVADHSRFKEWCDEYFYLPHRGEARGIGGIFFDYLKDEPEETFAFVRDAGSAFLDSYVPIVLRHVDAEYGDREREWQLMRRGRYVEFNLVHDRGTRFGLMTGGRTESILMSLPRVARWGYRADPEPGTPEAQLLRDIQPRDWVSDE